MGWSQRSLPMCRSADSPQALDTSGSGSSAGRFSMYSSSAAVKSIVVVDLRQQFLDAAHTGRFAQQLAWRSPPSCTLGRSSH
jgi:hypothetical protein